MSTERYILFADALHSGKTQTDAAIAAGYKETAANRMGKRLVKRAEVQARLAELRKGSGQKAEGTRQRAVQIAERIMDDEAGKPYERMKAIEVLAKLEGWNAAEKVEHGGSVQVQQLTEAELWSRVEALKKK